MMNDLVLPLVTIQAPKNSNGLDLSDHYPIVIEYKGLKLVSYNIQLIPLLIGGVVNKSNLVEIELAVSHIVSYFKSIDADVCCVQELFDDSANQMLEQKMAGHGYSASKRLHSSIIPFSNGGVRTFVKNQYAAGLAAYEYVYQNVIDYFIGADATVHKGIVHLSLLKHGIKYHIFNTHLQAFYQGREHYAEVTLHQCIELKEFVQQQIIAGIIDIEDVIFLCGDFNIPLTHDKQSLSFLYEKMKLILGPKFHLLGYVDNPLGPKNTLSRENTYNTNKGSAIDIDIDVDMFLLYREPTNSLTGIDIELSDIYSNIQRSISLFVRKNATLFSSWSLSLTKTLELDEFNQRFKLLINDSERIKSKRENPLDNKKWLEDALHLLSGPGTLSSSRKKQKKLLAAPLAYVTGEVLIGDGADHCRDPQIKRCHHLFEKMMFRLRKIQLEIHDSYIDNKEHYTEIYLASIQLNHHLFNESNSFFHNPSIDSFNHFKKEVLIQLRKAQNKLVHYPDFWTQIDPVIKVILGIIAILSIIPMFIIMASSTKGYIGTFFSPVPISVEMITSDFECDISNAEFSNSAI
jgi:endonuclease/exonuclease/phosphatase family metal-dependent hydrolase